MFSISIFAVFFERPKVMTFRNASESFAANEASASRARLAPRHKTNKVRIIPHTRTNDAKAKPLRL